MPKESKILRSYKRYMNLTIVLFFLFGLYTLLNIAVNAVFLASPTFRPYVKTKVAGDFGFADYSKGLPIKMDVDTIVQPNAIEKTAGYVIYHGDTTWSVAGPMVMNGDTVFVAEDVSQRIYRVPSETFRERLTIFLARLPKWAAMAFCFWQLCLIAQTRKDIRTMDEHVKQNWLRAIFMGLAVFAAELTLWIATILGKKSGYGFHYRIEDFPTIPYKLAVPELLGFNVFLMGGGILFAMFAFIMYRNADGQEFLNPAT